MTKTHMDINKTLTKIKIIMENTNQNKFEILYIYMILFRFFFVNTQITVAGHYVLELIYRSTFCHEYRFPRLC